MDNIVIGLKLYLFDILIMLDFCPFYWKLVFETVHTEDGVNGFVIALGPLFFEVLE